MSYQYAYFIYELYLNPIYLHILIIGIVMFGLKKLGGQLPPDLEVNILVNHFGSISGTEDKRSFV